MITLSDYFVIFEKRICEGVSDYGVIVAEAYPDKKHVKDFFVSSFSGSGYKLLKIVKK